MCLCVFVRVCLCVCARARQLARVCMCKIVFLFLNGWLLLLVVWFSLAWLGVFLLGFLVVCLLICLFRSFFLSFFICLFVCLFVCFFYHPNNTKRLPFERIRQDNYSCYHTETEAVDHVCFATQSQYTDTKPVSLSNDPTTPGAGQCNE